MRGVEGGADAVAESLEALDATRFRRVLELSFDTAKSLTSGALLRAGIRERRPRLFPRRSGYL